jgi:hypothetical protein
VTRLDPLARSAHRVPPAANEPRRGPLAVEILAGVRNSEAFQTFWALVGDLAADLLLDGTEGPRGRGLSDRER